MVNMLNQRELVVDSFRQFKDDGFDLKDEHDPHQLNTMKMGNSSQFSFL